MIPAWKLNKSHRPGSSHPLLQILGPISWILLAGAVWIVLTLLISVFWFRLKRAEPRITKTDEPA